MQPRRGAGQQPVAVAEAGADGVAQPLHQRRQAAGPGQHRALGGVGGVAVAAGEIVQPGPGRDPVIGRAVVVAAAVVQIPVQRRRGVAFALQPLPEGQRIQGAPRRVARGQHDRDAEDLAAVVADRAVQAVHQRQELAVLLDIGLGQPVHRQEAVFPTAVAQQAFLRRVRQDGLVVVGPRAKGVALGDAEVGQHFAHVGGLHRRQRQVVRAERVVQPVAVAGGGVAAVLGALDHDEIGEAFARQLPGARQAGHAGPQDRHLAAPGAGRRRQCRAIAQRVAGLHAGVAHVRRGLDHARTVIARRARGGGGGGAQQEGTAPHQRMTLRQSSSK